MNLVGEISLSNGDYMTKEQQRVLDFHIKFDCKIEDYPTLYDPATAKLRARLIREELREFVKACREGDLVGIADALGDILYVVYGAAISAGIDMEPIVEEIHRSNMTKLWPDGEVHRDEYGKVVKPDSYSPANLKTLVERQIRLGKIFETFAAALADMEPTR